MAKKGNQLKQATIDKTKNKKKIFEKLEERKINKKMITLKTIFPRLCK